MVLNQGLHFHFVLGLQSTELVLAVPAFLAARVYNPRVSPAFLVSCIQSLPKQGGMSTMMVSHISLGSQASAITPRPGVSHQSVLLPLLDLSSCMWLFYFLFNNSIVFGNSPCRAPPNSSPDASLCVTEAR